MATQPQSTAEADQPAADNGANAKLTDRLQILRPERARLSAEEIRARMESFASEREEAFVAAVRQDPD